MTSLHNPSNYPIFTAKQNQKKRIHWKSTRYQWAKWDLKNCIRYHVSFFFYIKLMNRAGKSWFPWSFVPFWLMDDGVLYITGFHCVRHKNPNDSDTYEFWRGRDDQVTHKKMCWKDKTWHSCAHESGWRHAALLFCGQTIDCMWELDQASVMSPGTQPYTFFTIGIIVGFLGHGLGFGSICDLCIIKKKKKKQEKIN